ncbi:MULTISPECIES: hypothetical protein [unclassified Streptomyces]|uniref:hypothetical protein n=1 Tax=unclassified Streptomyces TaxID=2593676 RepID=UPI0037B5070A
MEDSGARIAAISTPRARVRRLDAHEWVRDVSVRRGHRRRCVLTPISPAATTAPPAAA